MTNTITSAALFAIKTRAQAARFLSGLYRQAATSALPQSDTFSNVIAALENALSQNEAADFDAYIYIAAEEAAKGEAAQKVSEKRRPSSKKTEPPAPKVVSDVSDESYCCHGAPAASVRVVTLEGRATRYVVVATRLPSEAEIQGWLVTLTYGYNPQCSLIVSAGANEGPIFTHWVEDKTGLTGYDAFAVAYATALVTGREHVTL